MSTSDITTTTQQFTLGDALRKARVQSHRGRLSQAFMATALGVSRPTISAWENNSQQPPFKSVVEWGQVTGWPLEWFVGATDSEGTPVIHGLSTGVQLDLFEPTFELAA